MGLGRRLVGGGVVQWGDLHGEEVKSEEGRMGKETAGRALLSPLITLSFQWLSGLLW